MFLRNIYDGWSIKVRLTVILVLVSTAISYLMYGITHDTLHTSLSREENDFIYDRLHTIRAIINGNPDYREIIKKDIDWEGEHVPYPYYYIRLLNDSGNELIETPGMKRFLPAQQFPPALRPVQSRYKDDMFRASNGRCYLLMTDCTPLASGAPCAVTIQIALDITSEVTIDEANHRKLVLVGVLRSLIFSLIIIMLVRKFLKPLDEMVATVEAVSLNNISTRVDSEGWPDEVKRLALSFNGMLDRLAEAFDRLSDCASSMAHEIRTPINNMMGEAEVALSRERSPDEYRKVLLSSLEECQRLSDLTNSLLFLAHAEKPNDSLNRVRFDPTEEIDDVLTFYAPQVEGKGAVVSCNGKGEIDGDPLLFRQAISNLLSNALHYSKNGVSIDFTIAAGANGMLEVTVKDTGFGIPQEELPKVFARFKRGENSRHIRPGGSGLGLSIVKAIMALHHGSVSINSKVGEGTEVKLAFPDRRQQGI